MAQPSVQVQELIRARQEFHDVVNFKTTRAALPVAQALMDNVDTVLSYFYPRAKTIYQPLSGQEIDVAATEVRNDVDSYMLVIKQGIGRLEKAIGKTHLTEVHDVMKQTLHGEVERMRRDARSSL